MVTQGNDPPTMDPERRYRLEQRFGFADWGKPGPDSGGLELPVEPGRLLPGYELLRADPLRDKGLPGGVRILWSPGEAGPSAEGILLSAEVWSAASPAAARELLLALLDQFQSPLLARLEGARAVGDVAFGHGDHAVVFALGNLVVRLRNAGRELLPVAEPARVLAERLGRAPELA